MTWRSSLQRFLIPYYIQSHFPVRSERVETLVRTDALEWNIERLIAYRVVYLLSDSFWTDWSVECDNGRITPWLIFLHFITSLKYFSIMATWSVATHPPLVYGNGNYWDRIRPLVISVSDLLWMSFPPFQAWRYVSRYFFSFRIFFCARHIRTGIDWL